ncbi:hypothetical protein [Spirillospora albida]|uniref:hypothetical protein n=1 Tax=Spirillospora albida TaxID=58123 RepID=UPI0004BF9B18|nr:hypothetical protein [Spirillospora albida]
MQVLAKAVIYAATYIAVVERADDDVDDDVDALESITAYLAGATEAEQSALAAAAEEMLAAELNAPSPRVEYVAGYRSFMESVYGES